MTVTNQYNLVPAKRMISLAGKVIAGLVESNGSYHRFMTKSPVADCQETEISSMPNAHNRVCDCFAENIT